jgi:hypothetical protein
MIGILWNGDARVNLNYHIKVIGHYCFFRVMMRAQNLWLPPGLLEIMIKGPYGANEGHGLSPARSEEQPD